MFYRIKRHWIRFWMRFGGTEFAGRMATRLALLPVEPFRHRYSLASLYPHGFIAPDANVCKDGLDVGEYIYIGSNVTIYRRNDAGNIIIGDRVYLNESITIEAGFGGSLEIGEETHIQPGCQFSAYMGIIKIGRRVQIAPRCAFYPYDHGIARDKSMMDQPLVSRGGITVGDGAWIGYGAIILDGVTIGSGAVIGAGSIVKRDIPDYAIAAGTPAKVIKVRE